MTTMTGIDEEREQTECEQEPLKLSDVVSQEALAYWSNEMPYFSATQKGQKAEWTRQFAAKNGHEPLKYYLIEPFLRDIAEAKRRGQAPRPRGGRLHVRAALARRDEDARPRGGQVHLLPLREGVR